jgi:hypothetical protein
MDPQQRKAGGLTKSLCRDYRFRCEALKTTRVSKEFVTVNLGRDFEEHRNFESLSNDVPLAGPSLSSPC